MKQPDGVENDASVSAELQAALQAELAACKQVIQTLQARNCELQAVLDSMPQNIFWKDQNSVYRGCNRRFAEVAGFVNPDQIVGKDDYELKWTKEEADAFREFDRQVMELDQAQLYVVEPPSEINEQQGWVATSKIPLHDPTGRVIGLLGMFEDITERAKEEEALRQSESQLRQQAQQLRQALNELKQTQAQLIQIEKMSSLGQLVAGIAHEINNPVGFIHGNLCYAHEHTQDLLNLIALYQQHYPQPVAAVQSKLETVDLEFLQEDLPHLFRSMQMGAERIRQIVVSLRTFSRLDEAEVKTIDLHESIDSTLMILQSRLRDRNGHDLIQVTKDYAQLPPIECYAGQLNQVILHLLNNAIDALESRYGFESAASVTSRLSSVGTQSKAEIAPTIAIQTKLTPENWVEIQIADNGIGISEQIINQIFNPFFTTKPPGKGTGLGLSISYQIITEQHNGSLHCTARPGAGATFVIRIPVHLEGMPS